MLAYLAEQLKTKKQVDTLVEFLHKYQHGVYREQKLVQAMKNIAKAQTRKTEKFTGEMFGVIAFLLFLTAFIFHTRILNQPSAMTPATTTTQTASNQAGSNGAAPSGNAQKLVAAALKWAGRDFEPGQGEMCARFVRTVIKEAGLKDPGTTTSPLDGMMPTSPDLANGLSGKDIGTIITDENQVQAGDIVFWHNTYGKYSDGTITHTGIAVGNGMVVDRSTKSHPVNHRRIGDVPTENGGNAFKAAVRINWGN